MEAKITNAVRASRPVLRTPVIVAALCFFTVLVYISFVELGWTRIFFALLACVLVWNCFTRFKLEHSIVQSHGESMGTVSNYRRLGTKRWGIIDYTFVSADNKTDFGTLRGSTELPQQGQTFLVIYNLLEPSLSLPLFSFWFYRFDFEFRENDVPTSSSSHTPRPNPPRVRSA
jgi:hypothetical protein